jgi:glycosyltransferase involved in cell wall biosynthesis
VEAVGNIRREYPEVMLEIVGSSKDPAYMGYLTDLVSRLELKQNVHFLGWREEIGALLSYARALIHVGVDEGLPHTIREAMAEGIPVIAPRSGAMDAVIHSGETGLTFAPGDVEDLKSCICRVLDDPQGAMAMGRRAKCYAGRAFSWDKWKKGYAELVARLVAE